MATIVRSGEQGISAPENDAQGSRLQGGQPEDLHKARLIEADRLAESGRLADAWAIVERHLSYVSPDTPRALHVAFKVWWKQKKNSVAYQFAKRLTEVDPGNTYAWCALGLIEDSICRYDAAEKCFRKAELLANSPGDRRSLYLNWGCMLVNAGRWDEALAMARKSYEVSPDSKKSAANLGIALLAHGDWKQGWPLYDAIIGFDQSRRKHQYAHEVVWDGTPGERVVIYGEQGLGDEITFASMIPDAIAVCKEVVIDCDKKLEGLFRRSFPKAKVYGTRWEENIGWDIEGGEIDSSISVGGLGKLFRPTPESCPKTPYLVPDPDRVSMWRGLFAKQGKPVIGLAWSGGVAWTGDRHRRFSLEEALPLFQSVDAVWVSLEYKDASAEIAAFKDKHPEVDIRQYPFGTLTDDYDDTAAMVAALDLVLCPPTAVARLAGAIGTPCVVMKVAHGNWVYQAGMPFHPLILVEWMGTWEWTILDAVEVVRAQIAKGQRWR